MKVKKGRIQRVRRNGVDFELREKLKRVLKSWFNLEIRDIVEIIRKLGVTDENYEITLVKDTYYRLTVKVATSNDEFYIELFRGRTTNLSTYEK